VTRSPTTLDQLFPDALDLDQLFPDLPPMPELDLDLSMPELDLDLVWPIPGFDLVPKNARRRRQRKSSKGQRR
jgi:hypothetical protein